jgi:hypothetical protein
MYTTTTMVILFRVPIQALLINVKANITGLYGMGYPPYGNYIGPTAFVGCYVIRGYSAR